MIRHSCRQHFSGMCRAGREKENIYNPRRSKGMVKEVEPAFADSEERYTSSLPRTVFGAALQKSRKRLPWQVVTVAVDGTLR